MGWWLLTEPRTTKIVICSAARGILAVFVMDFGGIEEV